MHALEIDWIRKLHDALRSPCLDQLMHTWKFFDSFGFAIILIGIVWYLVDQKTGIRIFYILLLSSIVNILAKHAFGLPRPCHIDPNLGVCYLDSPGFPSGGAQTAIILSGLLFIENKKTIYRVLGVLFGLSLCFSRVYLGVHFFTDILGGLALGGLLLVVYKKIFPLAKERWESLSFLLPSSLLLIAPDLLMFQFGVSLGVAIGLSLNMKVPITKKSLLQCVLAIGGAFGLMVIGKTQDQEILGFFAILSGLWFSYAGAWTIDRITRLFLRIKKIVA